MAALARIIPILRTSDPFIAPSINLKICSIRHLSLDFMRLFCFCSKVPCCQGKCGTHQTDGRMYRLPQVCSCMPRQSSRQESLSQYEYQETGGNWCGQLSDTVFGGHPNHRMLKEYDLEHKNDINLRTSSRSLAILFNQHIFKCRTKHLKVDQDSELLKGIAHFGEGRYCKLLLKQAFTHWIAVYRSFLHNSVVFLLQSSDFLMN